MVNQADAALESELFSKWKKKSKANIPLNECVGYIVPLFLNGKTKLSNLELSDMQMYLDICNQLWITIEDIPEGTKIKDIKLVDEDPT